MTTAQQAVDWQGDTLAALGSAAAMAYDAWEASIGRGVASLLMRMVRALALLPFLAMLIGPFFVNRVTPTIFGLPFLLAWLVAWILLTAAIMAVIFRLDPANHDGSE